MLKRYIIKSVLSNMEHIDDFRLDLERWLSIQGRNIDQLGLVGSVLSLSRSYPEFRNIVSLRFVVNTVKKKIIFKFYKTFFPLLDSLYIVTRKIGPGLFIQHGFSTIVCAESIGKNCIIAQQVTIGHSGSKGAPTIGDDVLIGAGSILVGNISIGDRVVIGAGTVVSKSVPSDSRVVSQPFRML